MKTQAPARSDRIYDEVLERILSGQLPADAPIRQDALAEELGVSKIPLREALARLESGGLVASHANRGFVVRALSAREAEDVFDLRLKLEPDAAALGALEANEVDRAAAMATLEALNAAVKQRSLDVGRRNRAFHLALIRPARRVVTTETLERLLALSERYVRVHLGARGRAGRARNEHETLLTAWLARREPAVRREVTRHIRMTLADLRRELPPL
ncbi:MAG: GntR family transcriptional regulator [Hyphomonadaceae bacterium]